jgi:hypothetical protein
MGLVGLTAALPRGGQINEEYPANLANYMDGLLKRHWLSNRLVVSTISTPAEVSLFVCFNFS